MGVIVFGFVLFAVAMPLAWALERVGIMEVPASSLREVAGSSRRNITGAREV